MIKWCLLVMFRGDLLPRVFSVAPLIPQYPWSLPAPLPLLLLAVLPSATYTLAERRGFRGETGSWGCV